MQRLTFKILLQDSNFLYLLTTPQEPTFTPFIFASEKLVPDNANQQARSRARAALPGTFGHGKSLKPNESSSG